jgi:hypothetical protein
MLSPNRFDQGEEPMKNSKSHRNTQDELLIEGIRKHVGQTGHLVVAGKKYRVAEVLRVLQSRIDAAKAVANARIAWLDLVGAEQARIEGTKEFVASLRQCLAGTYGSSMEVLADFGLVKRARPTRTVDEKSAAVAKALATRKARHTMGNRQKGKIKGTVATGAAPPAIQPPPQPISPSTPSSGNGANGSPVTGHS